MAEQLELLKQEYEEKQSLYERFCKELVTQLSALLAEEKITLALPIESRVKNWSSIAQKCNNDKKYPTSLNEFSSDIAGLRIVLLFERDLNKVTQLIEEHLHVIQREDTHDRLNDKEFGYGSIHYDIEAPKTWLSLPTLKNLGDLRGEIQIRTASQHIWAAASHILQYKRESDVPMPIKRSINRVAALLEIVDLEFERVLSEREKYINEPINEDQEINADSLMIILDTMWPLKNKIDDEPYSELLEELKDFKITTPKQLKHLITEHSKQVMDEEIESVNQSQTSLEAGHKPFGTTEQRTMQGVYFTHVGLTRSALSWAFNEGFIDYHSKKYNERKDKSKKVK